MTNIFGRAAFIRANMTDAELEEIVEFPIRSEAGKIYLINSYYAQAFAKALKAVTEEKICALALYAERDIPRLFPSDPHDRINAPDVMFPLGRIIWDAGPGEQVERKNKRGASARDWSIRNTSRKPRGKLDNNKTRQVFLQFIESAAGLEARSSVEEALLLADALHRPHDIGALVYSTQSKKDREE